MAFWIHVLYIFFCPKLVKYIGQGNEYQLLDNPRVLQIEKQGLIYIGFFFSM